MEGQREQANAANISPGTPKGQTTTYARRRNRNQNIEHRTSNTELPTSNQSCREEAYRDRTTTNHLARRSRSHGSADFQALLPCREFPNPQVARVPSPCRLGSWRHSPESFRGTQVWKPALQQGVVSPKSLRRKTKLSWIVVQKCGQSKHASNQCWTYRTVIALQPKRVSLVFLVLSCGWSVS